MPDLTNARKVYQTPELISTILGFLDPADYWRVLSLERSFFALAAGVIWRDVKYEVAQAALKSASPRAQLYVGSIRGITLTDSNSNLPKDEKSQLRCIKSLIDNFPHLLKARRITSTRLGSRKYDWSIHKEDDGLFGVDKTSQMVLRKPPRSRSSRTRGVDDSRMRIKRGIEVVIDTRKDDVGVDGELMIQRFAEGTINDQLKNKIVAYLLNTTRRDPDICGIVIEDLQMDIRELTRICSSINGQREQGRLKKLTCKNLRPFEYEELEHFCVRYSNSQPGLDGGEGEIRNGALEVLVLDHIMPICKLRLTHINRIISLINEHFPNLWYLEIPITILQPGGQNNTENGFINVNEIVIPDMGLNRMRNLEKVVINVFGNSYRGLDLRFPFPVEDVAQNLAALNAPELCRYEIRNRTSVFLGMDVSRKLNREVHKYQRLAPDGLIAFHAHDNPPSYDSIS
ncbi:hypothetical protein I302_101562 [Kwoniella bestiolae CBS 10118]|uniref:Uncharacterized protein n=1 Tax=Kwoniella bestiolae CBS 10118 TaxID=1296100 RepID=A0A1B9GCM8_9TREE|nr:hypothetical protein I302_00245 [Kwoniella bestiolae CBS 10118]OCF28756.1 hypothetical protein I302_00245 [Kwoniella bestiolae CBS 10118]